MRAELFMVLSSSSSPCIFLIMRTANSSSTGELAREPRWLGKFFTSRPISWFFQDIWTNTHPQDCLRFLVPWLFSSSVSLSFGDFHPLKRFYYPTSSAHSIVRRTIRIFEHALCGPESMLDVGKEALVFGFSLVLGAQYFLRHIPSRGP